MKLRALDAAAFPTATIGSLVTSIRYGTGSPPPYLEPSDDTVPFVRATDIKNGEVVSSTLRHVSANQPPSFDKCKLNGGELIVVRSGVNTGDCAVIPESLRGAFAAYDLILSPQSIADAKFLAHFLDTEVGRLQLNLIKGRAAQPHVNADEVAAIRLPFPKDPVVRDHFLAELDAARAARDAGLAAADAALDGIDSFILGELGLTLPSPEPLNPYAIRLADLSEGRFDPFVNKPWYGKLLRELEQAEIPKKTLGTLVQSVVGGATPSRSDESLYASEGIPLLRINNIAPNELKLDDCRFITDAVHEGDLGRSQLRRGDVLMTITGRVGTTAVYDLDDPANINQHLVRLRLKSDGPNPFYLAAFLNSAFGLALSNRSVTGATRVALDYDSVRALPIPMPPIAMQNAIVAEVDRRRADARRLRAEARADWARARQAFEEGLLRPAA